VARSYGLEYIYPGKEYRGDNAAMIGSAAYYEYQAGREAAMDINAVPNLKLGER